MKKLVLISCLILSACASNTEKSLPNNVLRTDTERAMGWPEKYIRALGAREEMANGSSVAYTVRTKDDGFYHCWVHNIQGISYGPTGTFTIPGLINDRDKPQCLFDEQMTADFAAKKAEAAKNGMTEEEFVIMMLDILL